MSTRLDQARDRRGPHEAPGRQVGRALVMALALLIVILSATPALAYWTASGAGSAVARTGTLAPPTGVTVPALAVSDVPVNWVAGTGGVRPEGYYVTRNFEGGAAAACNSSAAGLLPAASCVDSDVPDGDYTYVVTAVFATWTASAGSSAVTVANPTRLGFVTAPTDTTANAVITPSVVVTLLSAAGDVVAYAGVPVTLSIGSNPGNGSLFGTTTVVTASDGSATFADLVVDRGGVGYTLIASSPDLASATSLAFSVLPRALLGDASSYSVLGGAGVVSTLTTTLSGDLGTGPGFVATGFPPGVVGGDIHLGDASAVSALADAAEAYTALRALPASTELSGNLGGLTLTPGVYHSTAALAITGILTLDGGPDDTFVIQVDAALNTAAGDRIVFINGAEAANVYWVVDGAVGLGAGTQFKGTVLARGAITLGLDTELIGRALATGAVTMHDATIRFTPALAPTLTIAGGATLVTKDTTPAISGTSSVPVGTAVKVSLAGQTLMTTVDLLGGWSVTAAPLLANTYTIGVQVRDAAGDSTRASQTLIVEVNPDPVPLRSAASFSVLSGATGPAVTNIGFTTVSGDVGSAPGMVTGFPLGTSDGEIHSGDATAAAAKADLLLAIDNAAGRAPHTQFAGDLGGRTFHAGVHQSFAAVGLTGTVTLDGEDDTDATFIFQISGAMTAAAGCRVNLVNGAQASNVFWVVDGAAGTGASCDFAGTILARGAVTLGLATALEGRALSLGAVTLATNAITGATPAQGAETSNATQPSGSDLPSGPESAAEGSPSDDPSPTSEPSPSNHPSPGSDPSPSAASSPTEHPGSSISEEPDTSTTPSDYASAPVQEPLPVPPAGSLSPTPEVTP